MKLNLYLALPLMMAPSSSAFVPGHLRPLSTTFLSSTNYLDSLVETAGVEPRNGMLSPISEQLFAKYLDGLNQSFASFLESKSAAPASVDTATAGEQSKLFSNFLEGLNQSFTGFLDSETAPASGGRADIPTTVQEAAPGFASYLDNLNGPVSVGTGGSGPASFLDSLSNIKAEPVSAGNPTATAAVTATKEESSQLFSNYLEGLTQSFTSFLEAGNYSDTPTQSQSSGGPPPSSGSYLDNLGAPPAQEQLKSFTDTGSREQAPVSSENSKDTLTVAFADYQETLSKSFAEYVDTLTEIKGNSKSMSTLNKSFEDYLEIVSQSFSSFFDGQSQ